MQQHEIFEDMILRLGTDTSSTLRKERGQSALYHSDRNNLEVVVHPSLVKSNSVLSQHS